LKAKGSPKKRGREPLEKLDPDLNEHEVELRSLDGRHTRVMYVACLICGGRVKRDGNDEGGLLRYSYVNKEGRVREAMASCLCEIGEYLQQRSRRGGFKVQRYTDLPDDLRLPTAVLETEAQVRDFNRRKYAELCKKVRQSYRCPDTHKWIQYDADGKGKPTEFQLTDPEQAMGVVSRVLERVYKKMSGKGLPLPQYKTSAKVGSEASPRPAQREPSTDPSLDREAVPVPAGAEETKGDEYDDDGLPF